MIVMAFLVVPLMIMFMAGQFIRVVLVVMFTGTTGMGVLVVMLMLMGMAVGVAMAVAVGCAIGMGVAVFMFIMAVFMFVLVCVFMTSFHRLFSLCFGVHHLLWLSDRAFVNSPTLSRQSLGKL